MQYQKKKTEQSFQVNSFNLTVKPNLFFLASSNNISLNEYIFSLQRVSADIMKVVDLSPAMKSSAVIRTYTNCCIQTAWKIAMETDRVHLDNSVVRFSDFDTVKYDFYDEELENFDYVVWPALLSGNSQLIAKGVAMATSKVR